VFVSFCLLFFVFSLSVSCKTVSNGNKQSSCVCIGSLD
jgi:hypothetical protein